jgi:hypothetical protein
MATHVSAHAIEARTVIAAYERHFPLLRRLCTPATEARRTTCGPSAKKPVRETRPSTQYGSST